MAIDTWDEIRTAWQVVRAGTVSGAAEALGVHHATVIRHVDALEERLKVRLFQRHPRGYTPTEAGLALAQIADITDDQFTQLAMRIQGASSDIDGDLVISTLPALAPMLAPALAQLAQGHPRLALHLQTEERLARLEYGEAHVAVRAGPRPTEPDNVVQPLMHSHVGLYASRGYLDHYGQPESDTQMRGHRLVIETLSGSRTPAARWYEALKEKPFIALQSNETEARLAAVKAGVGLGFFYAHGPCDGLVEVLPPHPDWAFTVWLVTHVDLHRTPKVQAALAAIRAAVPA